MARSGTQRTVCAYVEALFQAKLISEDTEGNLISPAPNSRRSQPTGGLGCTICHKSLERYYMTLALITQRGSGNISARPGRRIETIWSVSVCQCCMNSIHLNSLTKPCSRLSTSIKPTKVISFQQ